MPPESLSDWNQRMSKVTGFTVMWLPRYQANRSIWRKATSGAAFHAAGKRHPSKSPGMTEKIADVFDQNNVMARVLLALPFRALNKLNLTFR